MCKYNVLHDLPNKISNEFVKCAICVENKMANKSFENNRQRGRDILEIMHKNVKDPKKLQVIKVRNTFQHS